MRTLAVLGTCLWLGAGTVRAADLPTHPSELPPLTPTTTFPRTTPAELQSAGYPDHMHIDQWPGWTPPVDANGETYGPRSLARGTALLERDGLVVGPGSVDYRGLHISFTTNWAAPVVLPFIEYVDMARHDLPPLLGVEPPATLNIVSPKDLDEYRALTGQDFWRHYAWQDSQVVTEPVTILRSRTLDGHAAFSLVTEWMLYGLAPRASWPAWFREGLGAYLSDEGTHLCNFVRQFRLAGTPVLLPLARVEAILGGPPDADAGLDREHYREARYDAFLMVWELIENRGGLKPLQTLMQAVKSGRTPDEACQQAYGKGFADLAPDLDCTTRPEPIGDATGSRSPHLRPKQP